MKKLLPIIGALVVTIAATAQSLKITNNITGKDVTGTKLVLTVNDSVPVNEAFTVTPSIKPASKSVKVKRQILTPLNGTINSFCWAGVCYPDMVTVSPDAVDFTKESASEFIADFYPMVNDVKYIGTFEIRYVFFDDQNTADSTSFDLQFNVKHNASVKHIAKNYISLSAVYPNPASVKAELNYKLESNYTNTILKVYNLLGTEVFTQAIIAKEGMLTIPVTALENGLYFITVLADNKALVTRKFTVLR